MRPELVGAKRRYEEGAVLGEAVRDLYGALGEPLRKGDGRFELVAVRRAASGLSITRWCGPFLAPFRVGPARTMRGPRIAPLSTRCYRDQQ